MIDENKITLYISRCYKNKAKYIVKNITNKQSIRCLREDLKHLKHINNYDVSIYDDVSYLTYNCKKSQRVYFSTQEIFDNWIMKIKISRII